MPVKHAISRSPKMGSDNDTSLDEAIGLIKSGIKKYEKARRIRYGKTMAHRLRSLKHFDEASSELRQAEWLFRQVAYNTTSEEERVSALRAGRRSGSIAERINAIGLPRLHLERRNRKLEKAEDIVPSGRYL